MSTFLSSTTARPTRTPRICEELKQSDHRVRVIRHETNKRHIATYNEGIALARGKYFVLLSADDLLTPGSLRRATDIMEAHPAVGLVYGHAISLYSDTRQRPEQRPAGMRSGLEPIG